MKDKEFAKSLVAKLGSPLYVYDLEEVERRAKTLQSILPADSALFYSFKANPLPAICALLCELGCRAEISSTGELKAALEAGFAPTNILYSGPGKTPAEIREALAAGVLFFSCESWQDLARLASIARAVNLQVKVLLRVNPAIAPKAQLAMTGVPSQFGFEEDDLVGNFSQKIKALRRDIEIIGIHVYYGTQICGNEAQISSIKNAIEAAERLGDKLELKISIVDVGGGFAWPYAIAGMGNDLTEIRGNLSELSKQRQLTASAQLWFESGRYLSASSGTLLTTVLAVKEAKEGKKYIIIDAGINHLGGMSGLGRILRPVVEIEPLEPAKSTDVETVDIVGPLCSPLDCLARNIKVPKLNPGDVVSIPNVGAYGLTASLIGFISRSPPLEVTYRGSKYIDLYCMQTGHQKII